MINLRNEPPEKFVDGLLFYGLISTQRTAGKKTGQTFNEKGKLFFNRLGVRQSDYEIHGSDQNIDLKVKTFNTLGISKETHKVKIGDELYDITAIDTDANDKYLYWYLSKMGRVNDQRST